MIIGISLNPSSRGRLQVRGDEFIVVHLYYIVKIISVRYTKAGKIPTPQPWRLEVAAIQTKPTSVGFKPLIFH
ncbi:MAG: hypothetical protein EAZ77_08930 [Nostocales cyanobacterium]|nr:MAG: hypothetical protein EAZ77_08930 [Nostocales cyanobacterium]